MLIQKTVVIDGRAFAISGAADDDYFLNIEGEAGRLGSLLQAINLAGHGIALDVGANCGLTSLAMAATGRSVIAYEPHPHAFEGLSATAGANPVNITPRNVAIGASSGVLKFFPRGPMNPRRSSGSHVWSTDHWQPASASIDVPCTTIDDEAADDVSFIKIDVEGHEEEVLRGANKTIDRYSPLVYVEFNSWCLIAIANRNPRDFLRYLTETFPFVYCFDGGKPYHLATKEHHIQFLHRNLIANGCVDDLLCSSRPL